MSKGFTLPVLLLVIVAIAGILYFAIRRGGETPGEVVNNIVNPSSQNPGSKGLENEDAPRVETLAEGLDTPWAIAFLPEGDMLVTERAGAVRFVSKEGDVRGDPVVTISGVRELSEGGLHGITLHPDFTQNKFVYVYYTYSGFGGNTLNRVSRFTYEDGKMTDEEIILDEIPGAENHDGGRIKFGPDKFLYITTGDAQEPSLAQDRDSLAGKILRVKDDGSPAPGNPFGNRAFSYGHRNPQGITWDINGQLYSTEHGPSGLETGNDEFNKIEMGRNYGWPEIRGTQTREGMDAPLLESGSSDTWAPAGLAFVDGSFYFAGLRGQALYEVNLGLGSPSIETYLRNEYGRFREVIAGPDRLLYITTSNRDGRGQPNQGDDKILRINPARL